MADSKPGLTFRRDSPTTIPFTDHDNNIDRLTFWFGPWVSREYTANTQVTDEGFLMIANKTTTDKAAPQPTGLKTFLLPDAPAWVNQNNVSQVSTAMRITDVTEFFVISRLRVWIPNISVNVDYRVVVTNLLTGAIDVGPIFSGESVGSIGWLTSNLPGDTAIAPGQEVEIALEALNSSATTSFNGKWDYSSSNSDEIPASGEAFERNNRTFIRFNDLDTAATDRSTELASVIPGTVITAGTQTWTVIAETDAGTYFEYEIDRSGVANADTLDLSFLFTIPTAAATDYVEITGFWTANPTTGATVEGARQFDDAAPLINDTAYGVDIETQHFIPSPDWDFQAFSDIGGASTSEVSKVVTVTANHTALVGQIVIIDTSGGTFTVTAPFTHVPNDRFTVLMVNQSTPVTLAATDPLEQPVANAAKVTSLSILFNGALEFLFDGTNWILI